MLPDPQAQLKEFTPRHEFFVGIDSDGCVFDTMEIKHKECFIPNIIKVWGLQAIAKYVREVGEFVNLYSCFRGINRWPGLVKVLDLVQERPEAMARRPRFPEYAALKAYCEAGRPFSDAGIRQAFEETGDPAFQRALAWSEAVNHSVDEMVEGVPPFPCVRESLERLAARADIMVVSATPLRTIQKEWAEHDLARYSRLTAGQEMGTKQEHLQLAAAGRYPRERILMIGDAPGDLKAARHIGALFFPIVPGNEERSWRRFYEEACDRFFNGTYEGKYEIALIDEFKSHLPERPPWRRTD